jgi:hypothetical protein
MDVMVILSNTIPDHGGLHLIWTLSNTLSYRILHTSLSYFNIVGEKTEVEPGLDSNFRLAKAGLEIKSCIRPSMAPIRYLLASGTFYNVSMKKWIYRVSETYSRFLWHLIQDFSPWIYQKVELSCPSQMDQVLYLLPNHGHSLILPHNS